MLSGWNGIVQRALGDAGMVVLLLLVVCGVWEMVIRLRRSRWENQFRRLQGQRGMDIRRDIF